MTINRLRHLAAGLALLCATTGIARAQNQGAVPFNDPKYQAALTPSAIPSGPTTSLLTATATPGLAAVTPFSSALDNAFGTTVGSVLTRGSSGWVNLPPGTAGQVLASNGAGAALSYITLSGTYTLPAATTTQLGGIEYSASNFTIPGGVLTPIFGTATGNFAAGNAVAPLPTGADTLTAAGTTQGTALVLTTTAARVTGGAATTGVQTVAFAAGQTSFIANDSASNKTVYPPTGGNFYTVPVGGGAATALAANAGFTIAPGTVITILPVSTTAARVY